jgi:hypothetical protein
VGTLNLNSGSSTIRDYTLHDYYEMTSNNEGQLCGALFIPIRDGILKEAAACIFFSFFFLFSRDRGRVPRLFRLFLFFLFERGD